MRTVLTVQTVRTMGWGHLSPNPILAMDRAPLIVTCLMVWHQCEWTGPLDRLYTHTNGLGVLAMDEGVRSMGLGPNLIFAGVPYRSFNPHRSHSKMGPPVDPTKKFSRWLRENSSHRITSQYIIELFLVQFCLFDGDVFYFLGLAKCKRGLFCFKVYTY